MRATICMILGGTVAVLATMAAAQPKQGDAEGERSSMRPAARSDRGGKSGDYRRPGRAMRGEERPAQIPPDALEEPDDGPRPPGEEPRGPGFRGHRPDDDRGRPVFGPDPERIDRVMEFLKTEYPRLYDRLSDLRDDDPRAFHRQLNRMLPRLPELMHILDRNPKLGKLMIEEHQLEMDIRETTARYHRAGDDATKQRLREMIGRQFDIRQERLQLMIGEMERELARKKEALAEQAAHKDEIVNRELAKRTAPDR